MDKVFWQRRKRKSLNGQNPHNFFVAFYLLISFDFGYVSCLERIDLLRHAIAQMGKQLNTENQVRRIDFLQLSDSEKASFIKEVKEALRQRMEEAKQLQNPMESNGTVIDCNPLARLNQKLRNYRKGTI